MSVQHNDPDKRQSYDQKSLTYPAPKVNPFEDAFFNRFGQWITIGKRKRITFFLIWTNLLSVLSPLSPHLPMGYALFVLIASISIVILVLYKIKYQTRVQMYIDFEKRKEIFED
jgi:hypothetical protein